MIVLKIDEIPQQHVGRGRAIIDPKVLEDNSWSSGQIIQLDSKSHVKVWPGSPAEYGNGLIKIDGITRQNIGAGIGDKISIKAANATAAQTIVLSPTEQININGLQQYMTQKYQNHVFTKGDTITLNTTIGKKLNRVSTLRSVKSIYMMIIAQLSKVLKSSPIVCGCRGSIFTSLKVSRRFCGLFDGLSSF